VIIAEFGSGKPDIDVAEEAGDLRDMAALHGVLLREFIEARPGHLRRLAVPEWQQVTGGGRPEQL